MKTKCNFLDIIAGILVIIGALNWGILGLTDINVVARIVGELNIVTRIIYILVGVSGLWMIYSFCKCSKSCSKTPCSK